MIYQGLFSSSNGVAQKATTVNIEQQWHMHRWPSRKIQAI
eukprot:SAG31_NODE_40957_length_278_cov_0.860335_1_plen_39_part_10